MAGVIKKIQQYLKKKPDKDNVLPKNSVPATELSENEDNKIEGILF